MTRWACLCMWSVCVCTVRDLFACQARWASTQTAKPTHSATASETHTRWATADNNYLAGVVTNGCDCTPRTFLIPQLLYSLDVCDDDGAYGMRAHTKNARAIAQCQTIARSPFVRVCLAISTLTFVELALIDRSQATQNAHGKIAQKHTHTHVIGMVLCNVRAVRCDPARIAPMIIIVVDVVVVSIVPKPFAIHT